MSAENLYMLRMELDIPRLMDLGRRRRLSLQDTDTAYLVHCALGETFGDASPQPFVIEKPVQSAAARHLSVLAYSSQSEDKLRARAQALADPSTYKIINWSRLAAKPLPAEWPTTCRLGFQVRVCPVVRMMKESPIHRKGAEVDAFLVRCWAVGDPNIRVDRDAVYRDWFSQQITRHGGAQLVEVKVQGFQIERLLRRTHDEERQSKRCQRPEAIMSGILEVTEGKAFAELLRRGIGRHRSFGFGMLLLKPDEHRC